MTWRVNSTMCGEGGGFVLYFVRLPVYRVRTSQSRVGLTPAVALLGTIAARRGDAKAMHAVTRSVVGWRLQ